MTTELPYFAELQEIQVEHGISMFTHEPFVKLRVVGEKIHIGQIAPDEARQLAQQLITCAERADYEGDFVRAALESGWEAEMVAGLLMMVRQGEQMRYEGEGGEPT